MTETADPQPFRLLPRLDATNEHFWTGGEHGKLQFQRCRECGYWIHPPSVRCPNCLSKDIGIDAVDGLAVVHTFTVNHQPWYPNLEPPYVIAIVELPEQEGLRLTTGLVGIDPDDVRIGMAVRVTFERYEDVWLPFFEPAS